MNANWPNRGKFTGQVYIIFLPQSGLICTKVSNQMVLGSSAMGQAQKDEVCDDVTEKQQTRVYNECNGEASWELTMKLQRQLVPCFYSMALSRLSHIVLYFHVSSIIIVHCRRLTGVGQHEHYGLGYGCGNQIQVTRE